MNRAVRKMHQRRCALKNSSRGGGFDVGMLSPIVPVDGAPLPTYNQYNECYSQMRPGELITPAQPELAQVAMAGGGCGCGMLRKSGGSRRQYGLMRGGQCGLMKGGQCGLMKGGQCGLMRGGRKTRRQQRGGNKGGFGLDPTFNVGGTGPIAEPARLAVPCDVRAGSANPFAVGSLQADPRASPLFYSATANQVGGTPFATTQAGGSYGGNAYDASCYRAPGSEMPVYPAESVGFHFTPSTQAGATLPDGVTAFNEVVQHVARLGGGRKRTYKKRGGKKRKASRKH